jgi:formylglycine-generating enzyme required for sulfatase activity
MTYQEFLNRYHFNPATDKPLGEGGFGTVYKAYDQTIDEYVAVKVCPVKEGGYSLASEVEMVANLPDHPNIAKYEAKTYQVQAGFSKNDLAIMKFYPDGNLAQYVQQHRPQGETLKNIVTGILSGIAFLHSNKDGKPVLIHRDLKPSNILMIRRPDGQPVPKIADFGLAKTSTSGKSLSNSGGAFTAQYMSPEQATFDKLDWRTDLWSFGSILYFICTGEHAFNAPKQSDGEASTGIISQQIRDGKLPSIDHIAKPYRDMIAACWQQDRTKRVQSATALLAILGLEIPQPAPPQPKTFDVRAAIIEIEGLLKQKNYAAALTKCKAALAEVPQHPRLQQLHQEINAALNPEVKTFDVRAAIAEIEGLLKTKNYDTALTKCKAALAEVPQHPRVLQLKTEITTAKAEEAKPKPPINGKPATASSGITTKLILFIAAIVVVVIGGIGLTNSGGAEEDDYAEEEVVEEQVVEQEEISDYGIDMVQIPGGTFQMGSNENDDEKPIHSVTLNGFSMSKYEVTQKQWYDIMGTTVEQQRDKANPSWDLAGVGDNYPIYYVSWEDIQDFLRKLNAQTGKRYRLPTEAEWEYAAQGGQNYKYAGSDNLGSVAWYSDNSGSKTHPVGQKSPNGYGLYDMSGNLWEWCEDVWHDNYNGTPTDGSAGTSGGNSALRVLRGGSWINGAGDCRSAYRYADTPDYRDFNFGFRIAL